MLDWPWRLPEEGEGLSVGRALDVLVAFALTFAIARHGLLAVVGTLPWLLLRDRRRPWPWGWFTLAAVALAVAIGAGVPDLGEASHALWAVLVQGFVWVHASGRGRWFWGGLALVGLAAAGALLLATWLATPLDMSEGVSAWWDRWHWLALGAVACGGVWALLVSSEDRRERKGRPGLSGAVAESGVLHRMAVGRAGEERVRNLLLDRLAPGTWVLNSLRLPGLGGDIDVLVIGPTGVFLLEVKTWSGAIQCGPDGHGWIRLRAGLWEQLPDPVAQVQREIGALRHYLEGVDPALCRRSGLWIEPLLVFAHPNSTVEARSSPIPVLSPEEAVEVIRAGVRRRPLSVADQERLAALVASAQAEPGPGAQAWETLGNVEASPL